jgi:hypothetical protein
MFAFVSLWDKRINGENINEVGFLPGAEVSDAQLRKATGLNQTQIDLGAEELEAEGMLTVERVYKLEE